jgi:hypothetical protein
MMSSNDDLDPGRAASFEQRLEWALLDLLDTLTDISVNVEARAVPVSSQKGRGQCKESAPLASCIAT